VLINEKKVRDRFIRGPIVYPDENERVNIDDIRMFEFAGEFAANDTRERVAIDSDNITSIAAEKFDNLGINFERRGGESNFMRRGVVLASVTFSFITTERVFDHFIYINE
jgi:hypothetical protein